MSASTPKIGIWAANLSALFAACFSIVALAANFTALVPTLWVNPLSFAPSLLLAWSYLVLMACVQDAALPEHRVWAVLGLCFAVLYATINSIVYFVQLVVVTPLVFQGNSELAGVLAFQPRSFMLSLNGLAYGLMSVSTFLAAFAFTNRTQRFVQGAMWAHGAIGPIVIAAIFWPGMTYVGALWIVTFPVMTLALARDFRRSEVKIKNEDQYRIRNNLHVVQAPKNPIDTNKGRPKQ
jgi:hypothetical protein